MAYLQIITRVVLPTEMFDAPKTTHEVGGHFKTFINALELADHEASFEVTTEDGGLKPIPRVRKPRVVRLVPTDGAA